MKIGITFSAFDLLHAGHKMLEDAKRYALFNCRLQTIPLLTAQRKKTDQQWNVT
jgi:glycerol-3-phosphate cytidylyltransferase